MSVDIVPSGALDQYDDFNPNGFFDGPVDAQTARIAVAKIRSLEEMLKAAEQFGEYATKFCLLEAQTYFRIAEIEGAEDKLTATQKDTVNFIRHLSDEGREQLLSEVADGVRIRTIINRERRNNFDNIKKHTADKEYKRIQESIISDLMTNGHTQLTPSEFLRRWNAIGEPDVATIKAYTESTRDKLLNRKGRGLGDGNGTYLLVSKCDRMQVAQIVQTRLESIVNDLKTIKQICDETHFVVPAKGVKVITELIKSLGNANDTLDITV